MALSVFWYVLCIDAFFLVSSYDLRRTPYVCVSFTTVNLLNETLVKFCKHVTLKEAQYCLGTYETEERTRVQISQGKQRKAGGHATNRHLSCSIKL